MEFNRETALRRLHARRLAFSEAAADRYRSGRRAAERDADRLEQIARLVVAAVDDLEREFERLDVARDACSYLGGDGVRIHRARWMRASTAVAFAEALEPVLGAHASAVLTAAIAVEIA